VGHPVARAGSDPVPALVSALQIPLIMVIKLVMTMVMWSKVLATRNFQPAETRLRVVWYLETRWPIRCCVPPEFLRFWTFVC